MSNKLIQSRDRFTDSQKEISHDVHGRSWGVIHRAADGPAIVLLPGTLGRGNIFWQQIDALDGRIHVLALSYPDTDGITEWADDIGTLMDRFGIKTASILGSSLGGYVAQYFAGTHAARTERLIAANTLCSVVGLDQMPPYSHDLETTPIANLRHGFKNSMDAALAKQPGIADLVELLMLEINGNISEMELRSRLKALKNAPPLPQIALDRKQIFTVESLDDPLIPPLTRQAVRDHLAPVRAYRFLQGGHFPYVVRPAEYTAMIEECLGLEIFRSPWKAGKMSEV